MQLIFRFISKDNVFTHSHTNIYIHTDTRTEIYIYTEKENQLTVFCSIKSKLQEMLFIRSTFYFDIKWYCDKKNLSEDLRAQLFLIINYSFLYSATNPRRYISLQNYKLNERQGERDREKTSELRKKDRKKEK